MKIRSSFVSNSSTTSFIIIGWKVDENKLKSICEKKKINISKDDDSWSLMEKIIENLKEKYTITGLLDDDILGIGYKNECEPDNNICQRTFMSLKKEATKLARELKIVQPARIFYGSTNRW